jgi:amino acid transporter
MNLSEVVALCSVGTLFAFVLVCGGILRLQNSPDKPQSRFKTPYLNSKWIVPTLFVITLVCVERFADGGIMSMLSPAQQTGQSTWDAWSDKIPYIAFGILFLVTSVLAFIKNYSLIPVLGFLSCSYLLCESGATNWERFLIWLVIGLVIYFLYGAKHSRLHKS